jgi:hypothetical protein
VPRPTTPTYRNAAGILERRTGSGLALAGWTVARSGLIFVPLVAVGVEPKRALAGSLLASSIISFIAYIRIANGYSTMANRRRAKQ